MSLSSLPQIGPVPDAMVDEFEAAFADQQRSLLRIWRLAAGMYRAAAAADREFLSDELALVMNVHPQTASSLLALAVQSDDLPALLVAWEAGDLTERHVRAAIEELHRCLDETAVRIAVLDRVLTRCRERGVWPRPGELRRMVRAAALLHDPKAARRREQAKTDERRTSCYPLADGQAGFALEGPAGQVVGCAEAVRRRAVQMSREPGETRTVAQLEFDLTVQLLTTGSVDDGAPAPVVEVQVVVPWSTAAEQGRAVEDAGGPGEIVGYGPITPEACRDLLRRATRLRRILVDPVTGQVVAVDDAVLRTADLAADLERLRTGRVMLRDLRSPAYRPTRRAVRFVRLRDRTCRFPGCTKPALVTDLDHRIAWPHGPTDPHNLHCLCRHHHRAKQSGRFTVTTQPDGTTVWTTRSGRRYVCERPQMLPQ